MIFFKDFFSSFSIEETISSFIIMFMVIDMVGLTPIIIDMRTKGREINAEKAAIWSLAMFLAFLFLGSSILRLFHVDIYSFAIGGSIVLFLMAIEMVLDVEIFRNNGPAGSSTMVPLVFPLIAGAGSFTTLLSLQSLYGLVNILIGLLMNIVIVYLVLRNVYFLERILGKSGVYVTRKFFGVMLLAVSIKMFLDNLVLFIDRV
ncbi:MAG: MarC family protein [Bacteroidales bacterium]|nr:MarC family protein [Bacteroidales bacterium]